MQKAGSGPIGVWMLRCWFLEAQICGRAKTLEWGTAPPRSQHPRAGDRCLHVLTHDLNVAAHVRSGVSNELRLESGNAVARGRYRSDGDRCTRCAAVVVPTASLDSPQVEPKRVQWRALTGIFDPKAKLAPTARSCLHHDVAWSATGRTRESRSPTIQGAFPEERSLPYRWNPDCCYVG